MDTSGIHLNFVVTIQYILDAIMSCTMHILFNDNKVKFIDLHAVYHDDWLLFSHSYYVCGSEWLLSITTIWKQLMIYFL